MSQENLTNEIVNQEAKGKRKDWIKNAAIVFLSVMLVLTFFSNTIMNYSLPEVATAWVESGSINAKIRGTGVLTSDDPYKISIQESRTIASVAVKAGDIVEKDQVLFYLEDKDSAELAEAEKALDELILSYTAKILDGTISNEAYNNIQSGKISSTGTYQARIEAAKAKQDSAETNVENLQKQIALLGTGSTAMTDINTELKNAQNQLNELSTKMTDASEALNSAKLELSGLTPQDTAVLESAVLNAQVEEAGVKDAFEAAKTTLFNDIKTYFVDTGHTDKDAVVQELFTVNGDGTLSPAFDDKSSDPVYMSNLAKRAGEASANLSAFQTAYETYAAKKTARSEAESKLEAANESNSRYAQLEKNISKLQKNYNSAKQSYENQNSYVNNLSSQLNSGSNDIEKQTENLNRQLIEAQAAQKAAEDEYTQLLTDISSELNLSSQNSIIREKQEEIAKLREKASGATITAPVAGVVTTIYKTAGENTSPDEELAIMQPEGKGYSMNVSVTEEQARKVTVGDIAEVQNSWYYSDLVITLTGIRPDPENPGRNKLLVFNVTGDVQAGQSLSISIGQKSASYDMLVPNSAVREDNNGKFIYIVESKNSPLGNRYIAVRTDVEVLASDDTKTAISAPLYGYEYVITTSTQPVEAGKQVRLAEN